MKMRTSVRARARDIVDKILTTPTQTNKTYISFMAGRPKQKAVDRRILSDVERLAESLLEWSKNPDSWFLATWMGENGLHRERLHRMAADSPIFRDAKKIAQIRLESNIAKSVAKEQIKSASFGIFALKQPENGGWKDKFDATKADDSPAESIEDTALDAEIQRLLGV